MLKIKQVSGLQAAIDAKIAASVLNANTVLYATADDTPAALALAASTVVGRKATGDVVALTAAELKVILGAGSASGLATLNGSLKVVEDPVNAQLAGASGKIPLGDGSGKLAASWGGNASTLATLNASSKVVEDPANAQTTPAASKIPLADGSGKLAAAWGGNASTLATLNASAKVVEDPANATATPTASKIVIADSGGKVDGWISAATDSLAGKVELATNAETATGTDATRAVTPAGLKSVLDNFTSAADAMVFKGTIGTGGTHTIVVFNALNTYSIGWTYRVITAGTIKGKVCEIGDLLIALVDREGSSEADADWTVVQTNLDGAVIGPTSATDTELAQFDGTSGKVIRGSGKSLSGLQSLLTARHTTATGNTGTADTAITITGFFGASAPSSTIPVIADINGVKMHYATTSSSTTKEIFEASGVNLIVRLPYALEASDVINASYATV